MEHDYERGHMQRRADDLSEASEDPFPGRFHWRRVPGTLALAIANLIATFVYLDVGASARAPVVARLGGSVTWGFAFGLSAAFLFAAILTRRWSLLNVGSVLSLFAWTATSSSIFLLWLTGVGYVSTITLALIWWMFAGQFAMLVTPLIARGRGT